MSLINRAFKGSLVVASSNYLAYGFNILAQLWLIRILSPELYGQYAVVLVVVEFTYVLLMLEFATACIYDMDNEEVFNTAVIMALVWTSGVILILFVVSPVAKIWLDEQTFVFAATLIVIKCGYGIGAVYGTYIERHVQFGRLSLIRAFAKILGLAVGIWLAERGFGIKALLAIDVVNYTLAAVLITCISPLKVRFRDFNRNLAMRLVRNSFSQFQFRLSGVALYRAPVILVQQITGDKALVGFMDRAMYLAQMVNAITSAFTSKIAFILFKRLGSVPGGLERSVQSIIWFTAHLLIPVLILFFIFSDEVVHRLYGEGWTAVAPLLTGLAPFSVVVVLYNIINQFYMSINRLGVVTICQWIMLIIMVVSGLTVGWFDLTIHYLAWIWSLLFFAGTISLTLPVVARSYLSNQGLTIFILIGSTISWCLLARYIIDSWIERSIGFLVLIVLIAAYDYFFHFRLLSNVKLRISRSRQ